MMLDSHGTGGARRRMRRHCKAHRPLTYRRVAGNGNLMFECHATDGRTYVLRLNAEDMEALHAAGLVRTMKALLDEP